jgi:hypothetical protein
VRPVEVRSQSTGKRQGKARRWGAAVVVLLLAGGGIAYWRHSQKLRYRAPTPEEVSEDRDVRRWTGFPTGQPPVDGPLPDAGSSGGTGWLDDRITKRQLEGATDAWRQAIINKDAETVLALDRAFTILPGRFGPQLVTLAETDPDERVRAFSTRVLGKLKNVELARVFRHLLVDPSSFVRQNAAWGLGELTALPRGRDAAYEAYDDLRRLEGQDPVTEVRTAATNTLTKLQ